MIAWGHVLSAEGGTAQVQPAGSATAIPLPYPSILPIDADDRVWLYEISTRRLVIGGRLRAG